MIHKIFNRRTLLVGFSLFTLLASHANAQTKVPASPALATAATPTPLKSAFEGYQAYSDDKMTNWRTANDEVARIGGWREYAKQAQALEVKPVTTPAPAAKTGDSNSKATP